MPKPPLRDNSDDDSDDSDDFARQETLVEKSDAMAREYSARRALRLRQEQAQRRSSEPPAAPLPAADERPRSSPRVTAPPRPGRAVEPLHLGAGELDRVPPARPPRDERPAPGLARKTSAPPAPPPLPRHAPPASPPAPRDRAQPGLREESPASRLDQLAMELEELLRELRHGWRNLGTADRVTLISSVFVIAGVFTPWLSDPAHPLRIGLLSGGVLHLALAIAAVVLIVTGTPGAFGGIGSSSPRARAHRQRRTSLWLVLIGSASTFLGAYLLLVHGLAKSPSWPVEVHVGFYWTLAAGTGLSYGGFARFSSPS